MTIHIEFVTYLSILYRAILKVKIVFEDRVPLRPVSDNLRIPLQGPINLQILEAPCFGAMRPEQLFGLLRCRHSDKREKESQVLYNIMKFRQSVKGDDMIWLILMKIKTFR